MIIRSEVLLNLRRGLALRQVDVAKFAGVARSQLSQLESGNSPSASIDTLNKLASFYNVALETLIELGTAMQPPRHTKTIESILARAMAEALESQPVAIPVVRLPVVGRIHAPSDASDVIDEEEVLDYVYLPRQQIAKRNVICLMIEGECLAPEIEEGDIVVIDLDNRSPNNKSIVVAQLSDESDGLNKVKIMRYREQGDSVWLETDTEKIEYGDAEIKGVAVRVSKDLPR